MPAQLELLPSRGVSRETGCNVTLQRDEAMRNIIIHAGRRFKEKAERFFLDYLAKRPQGATGEEITDAAKAAGIEPTGGCDDRAFGPVFYGLSRAGKIEKV